MLLTLLRPPSPSTPTSAPSGGLQELLSASRYELLEVTRRIGRASTCRFKRIDQLGDAALLPNRTGVRVTLEDGTCLFAGRTLPATRTINDTTDEIVYACADPLEWIATNNLMPANEWYNRENSDDTAYPYPFDYTMRQIIEAEFANLIGSGVIGGLDWSDLDSNIQNLRINEFSTKGKTYLGLLQNIANEIPVLGWAYDPSTTEDGEIEGGTLRFYDLSKVPTPRKVVTLAKAGAANPNVVSLDVQTDISQCYDRLVFNGWGEMQELYEKADIGWDWDKQGALSDRTDKYILRRTEAGVLQQFTPSSSGGTWSNIGDICWSPESKSKDGRVAFRRYRVSREIVDLRLVKDDSDPPKYSRADRSMWVEGIRYNWVVGPVSFTIDGVTYAGAFGFGIKTVPFTAGRVNDWGYVELPESVYPNYPDEPVPKTQLGTPSAYERNYFLTGANMAMQTSYLFSAVVDSVEGAEEYINLTNQYVFLWWAYGTEVDSAIWLRYTGKGPMNVVVEDATLGYNKELMLWDQRFLKYTNEDGEVLRDDTEMMTAYAQAMFALVSRPRCYGKITVICAPGDVGDYPLGCGLRVSNFNGGNYDVPARVQEIVYTAVQSGHEIELGFDSPNTYGPLAKSLEFRQWFLANEINGTSGLAGSTGSTVLIGGTGAGGGSTGNGGTTPNGGGGGGGGAGSGGGGGFGAFGSGADCCDGDTTDDTDTGSSSAE